MKVKKLIIAFCIIIFVPILLATATVVGFCNFQAHAIEETYGIKNTDAYSVINSVQLLNRYTVADFQKIQKKIQKTPDELVNMTYLQELNEELKQKNSELEQSLRELEIIKAENTTLKEQMNLKEKYGEAIIRLLSIPFPITAQQDPRQEWELILTVMMRYL